MCNKDHSLCIWMYTSYGNGCSNVGITWLQMPSLFNKDHSLPDLTIISSMYTHSSFSSVRSLKIPTGSGFSSLLKDIRLLTICKCKWVVMHSYICAVKFLLPRLWDRRPAKCHLWWLIGWLFKLCVTKVILCLFAHTRRVPQRQTQCQFIWRLHTFFQM